MDLKLVFCLIIWEFLALCMFVIIFSSFMTNSCEMWKLRIQKTLKTYGVTGGCQRGCKGSGVVYQIYTTDVWGGVGSSEVRSGLWFLILIFELWTSNQSQILHSVRFILNTLPLQILTNVHLIHVKTGQPVLMASTSLIAAASLDSLDLCVNWVSTFHKQQKENVIELVI